VRGVTEKKQLAVAHRLGYEAAHRGDALLQNWSIGELPAIVCSHSRAQFGPNAVVGPVGNIFLGITL
jgi:hypothetical protein